MRRHELRDSFLHNGPLQRWLLLEKQRSGLSFSELADLTFTSKSSLHRATQGFELPRREVFEAFVRGCNSDPITAKREWRQATYWHAIRIDKNLNQIGPESVTNHIELRQALDRLMKIRGVSLREAEKLASQRNAKLRRSTLGDSLAGRQNFSRASVAELARSCGELEDSVETWDEAWQRAERDRRGRSGHLGGMRNAPIEARHYADFGLEEIFRACERYGIPEAEIEIHIRSRIELRKEGDRGWGEQWTIRNDARETWEKAVVTPSGDVSRKVERAAFRVIMGALGEEVHFPLVEKVTKEVLKELFPESSAPPEEQKEHS
ncbi:hypothetical protein ACIHCV_13655 [Streptomyces sp. NPDC051956]|uniref:hypothetical protein n=1 Tax=Streptomyces sp. NPDC051956 TaxID=3365677 RepID=UPI0037D57D35